VRDRCTACCQWGSAVLVARLTGVVATQPSLSSAKARIKQVSSPAAAVADGGYGSLLLVLRRDGPDWSPHSYHFGDHPTLLVIAAASALDHRVPPRGAGRCPGHRGWSAGPVAELTKFDHYFKLGSADAADLSLHRRRRHGVLGGNCSCGAGRPTSAPCRAAAKFVFNRKGASAPDVAVVSRDSLEPWSGTDRGGPSGLQAGWRMCRSRAAFRCGLLARRSVPRTRAHVGGRQQVATNVHWIIAGCKFDAAKRSMPAEHLPAAIAHGG